MPRIEASGAGTAATFKASGLPMEKILVVEDDRAVQRALKRLFEAENYVVEVTPNGKSGLEAFHSSPPSVVVLDLRLPGIPGDDVCREIKKEAPSLPVIVLSAKTDEADKVLLLETGADDYVTKPFSPRELLARVHAVMRRASRPDSGGRFAFGSISVDFAKMELTRDGRPVPMTAQEFKILKFFSRNPERVISRSELLNEVWGYENYPSTRTVDNHIWRLRLKLEDEPSRPTHFLTIHGAGYKFLP
jgi:DNA-binding response OmpR family regulator